MKRLSYYIVSILALFISVLLVCIFSNTKTKDYHIINDNDTLVNKSALISFIFDDGCNNDAVVKNIFDSKNVKCGFAIWEVSPKYNKWYSEGFEILAHERKSPNDMKEDKAINYIYSSYVNIEKGGCKCYGWVTPQSTLKKDYRYIVEDIFDYGFTEYKGNITSGCVINTDTPFNALWRSSLESLTLEECKKLVDDAINENGLIVFYGHTRNLNKGNLSSDNLNELLDYCIERANVLIPHKAIEQLRKATY